MAHRSIRTPSLPDDIKARQQAEAEQARQKHQRATEAQRNLDQLVAAGNLVEVLGQDFELELRTDSLTRWVEAMADYKAVLAERGLLDRLAQPSESIPQHDRDAWQTAVGIFLVADTEPERAAAMLMDVAALPDFAVSVAKWLRHKIRGVAEGCQHSGLPTDGLATVPAQPNIDPQGERSPVRFTGCDEPPRQKDVEAATSDSVSQGEAAVLKVMLEQHPARMTVEGMAGKLRPNEKSIRGYLKSLQGRELVTEPAGKSGRALTSAGLELAKILPEDVGRPLLRKAH